jgi:hypothetical protein
MPADETNRRWSANHHKFVIRTARSAVPVGAFSIEEVMMFKAPMFAAAAFAAALLSFAAVGRR